MWILLLSCSVSSWHSDSFENGHENVAEIVIYICVCVCVYFFFFSYLAISILSSLLLHFS